MPTPTYDPLATPALPEHPTQEDLGRYSYYFNCMPCHGDRGQGLTDAWRQTWVEDHRNCWGRGCHAGHSSEEGFPIPTIVPAVILDQDALKNYASPQALFEYLKKTHPPQEPGRLEDDEYQTLVAFLWSANGKGSVEAQRPAATTTTVATVIAPSQAPVKNPFLTLTVGFAGALIITLLVIIVLLLRRVVPR